MKIIASIILIGFAGMMSLWFMPVDHETHHDLHAAARPCPVATLFNMACIADGLLMALIHISAIQALTHAPVPAFFVFLIFLLCLGLALFIFRTQSSRRRETPQPTYPEDGIANRSQVDERLRSWLSLFEHSPSLA